MAKTATSRRVADESPTMGGGQDTSAGGAGGGGFNPIDIIRYVNLFTGNDAPQGDQWIDYTGGQTSDSGSGQDYGQGGRFRDYFPTSEQVPVDPTAGPTSSTAGTQPNQPGTVVSRWAAAHPKMAKMLTALGIPLTLQVIQSLGMGDPNAIGGSLSENMTAAGNVGAGNVARFGAEALPTGFGTLLEILQAKGKTDPRLMNRTITETARGTQSNVEGTKQRLAQQGMSNAGVGQALMSSIESAGNRQVADIYAKEAQLEEQRKRDDLALMKDLILGPSIQYAGIERGIDVEESRMAEQRKRDMWQGFFTLLDAAATAYFD